MAAMAQHANQGKVTKRNSYEPRKDELKGKIYSQVATTFKLKIEPEKNPGFNGIMEILTTIKGRNSNLAAFYQSSKHALNRAFNVQVF